MGGEAEVRGEAEVGGDGGERGRLEVGGEGRGEGGLAPAALVTADAAA
jgi:hypothetical protein